VFCGVVLYEGLFFLLFYGWGCFVAYQDALKSKLDDLYSTAGAAVSDLSGVVAGADVLASQFADVKNALQDLQDLADGLRSGYAYTPTGVVVPFAGSDANKPPSGWLLCDGAAVSRSTYAVLFALISTTYGNGDGSTTFNVPDLRGRTIIGVGAAVSGATLTGVLAGVQGVNGGSTNLTTSHLPSHRHTINHNHDSWETPVSGGHEHTYTRTDYAGSNINHSNQGSYGRLTFSQVSVSTSGGGGHVHNIDLPNFEGYSGYEGEATPTGVSAIQPSMGLNYIIKA